MISGSFFKRVNASGLPEPLQLQGGRGDDTAGGAVAQPSVDVTRGRGQLPHTFTWILLVVVHTHLKLMFGLKKNIF